MLPFAINMAIFSSMDWFNGKINRKPRISLWNLGFKSAMFRQPVCGTEVNVHQVLILHAAHPGRVSLFRILTWLGKVKLIIFGRLFYNVTVYITLMILEGDYFVSFLKLKWHPKSSDPCGIWGGQLMPSLLSPTASTKFTGFWETNWGIPPVDLMFVLAHRFTPHVNKILQRS